MAVKAKLKWTDGLQFVARAGDSPAVLLDNHEGGSGSTPMEMVLMGAAGCTAMDVISIMKKKRVPIDRFEVTIEGDQAEDHPKRYTNHPAHVHIFRQGHQTRGCGAGHRFVAEQILQCHGFSECGYGVWV